MFRFLLFLAASVFINSVFAGSRCTDLFSKLTQQDVLVFGMRRLKNDPIYFRLHEEMNIDPRTQPVLNDLEVIAFEMVFYIRSLRSLEQTMALASRDELRNPSEFRDWHALNMNSNALAIHSVAGEFAFRAHELTKISQLEAEVMISHLLDQVEGAFKRVETSHPLHPEVGQVVWQMREDTTLHVP